MATENKKFVVTTAAEADEAEEAAAAFRLAARNEKFADLRSAIDSDAYDVIRAELQAVIDAATFEDDAATSLALTNTVMAMAHLKARAG